MQKRLGLILAMIGLGSSLLFSQDTSTLTPEQQEQFNSQKLTVTEFSMVLYSTHWVVSKGYDKINEPDFLRTVGLDKEALDSQSHLGTKSFLTWGGAGVAVVGLAVVLIGSLSVATNPNYFMDTSGVGTFVAEIGIGTVAIVGGSITMAIGMSEAPNITPYGRASDLADKYNAQLLIKIRGKDQDKPGTPDSGS